MTALIISPSSQERLREAREKADHGEHPSWCDREWCSVTADGLGDHQTKPFVIGSEHENEPNSLHVFLSSSARCEAPHVFLEVYHDPAVNEHCGLDDEPTIAVLSMKQTSRLLSALGQNLCPIDRLTSPSD